MTRKSSPSQKTRRWKKLPRIMADNKIGGLPVMREDKLVGIVTETDLFKAFLNCLALDSPACGVTALISGVKGTLPKSPTRFFGAGGNILAFSQSMDATGRGGRSRSKCRMCPGTSSSRPSGRSWKTFWTCASFNALRIRDQKFQELTVAEMEIGTVRAVDINTEMQDAYLRHAMSVIVARRCPTARDGLQTRQRRILYACTTWACDPTHPTKKSGPHRRRGARQVSPARRHGACTRRWPACCTRFLDALPVGRWAGNFGSVDGDAPAAMRYSRSAAGTHVHGIAGRH